jgi:hypothetical protein
MTWVLGIITFICAFIAISSTGLFILLCISSIINPQITVDEKGEVREKNNNARIMYLLISAIAWAIVIAL